MLQLPVELRRLCISFVDNLREEFEETLDTLKQLRLVNKEIGTIATEFLFGAAVLRSTDESAKALQELVLSPLSHLVRRTIIYTNTHEFDSQYESELLESFAEAVGTLHGFENLQELQLKFAQECAAEPDTYMDLGYFTAVCETPEYRSAVLKIIFAALEGVETVRVLSIRNLQDLMDRQIRQSDTFRSVRSRLTSLHLQITTENIEQHELDCAAIHQGFTVDLPVLWLKPTISHLTHLTLYSYTAMWGLYTFFDFRKIGPFLCLESLSLGNWTIAHEWQIDWILSHSSTLKQLLLDNCPIIVASRMACDNDMVRLNFPDLQPLPGEDHSPYFTLVHLRWRTVFDRFRSSLSQLEHFAMYGSKHDWTEDAFEHRYSLENCLRANRYHTFDGDWPDWEDPIRQRNKDHVFYHSPYDRANLNYRRMEYPACLDEDLQGLQELLEVVKRRGGNVIS